MSWLRTNETWGFAWLEQIEAFLLAPAHTNVQSQPAPQAAASKGAPLPESVKQPGSRKVSFRLFGQNVTQPDAISALIFLLQNLAKRDPGFMESFAKLAPGRTRNHIAKTREQVYPGKPELEVYTTEIAAGWWLGTNIANRKKERLAKIACEVAGLDYGKDVVIDFPNVNA